jgi:acetyl/propionyl-CoA carboxylase alpha subunit
MSPDAPARTISRLAIVTRGAPALRLIRAAREHAHEYGRDLRVIAIHADAERDALFVRAADEAVALGDGAHDEYDHTSLSAGVPPLDLVERALVAAVRTPPGSAGARSRRCRRSPTCATGWTCCGSGRAATCCDGCTTGRPWGAGGGGRRPPRRRGRSERPGRLRPGRHLEVLAVADHRGTAWAVDVHDGTLQRRTEKVLVESATGARSGVDLDALRASAERLMTLAGFTGAGTVTFVRPADRPKVALLRISVGVPLGHGITEMTTGVDLAKLQLHLAEGGRLEGSPRTARGHAISVRLNAEDAEAALSPAPGTVELLQLPSGTGIRVDSGVTEGDDLADQPDPTIAEVVAWGRDREEARVRLHLAVSNLLVVLDGGTTNKGFLLDLLDRRSC